MKIINILTDEVLTFNTQEEFGHYVGSKNYKKFFNKDLSFNGIFVKEEDLHNIYILKDVNSNELFKCISPKTMEFHLDAQLSRNEVERIYNLKNEKVFCIKIQNRHFILLDGNKDNIQDYNKKLRSKYKKQIKTRGKQWREKNQEYNSTRIKNWKIQNKSKVTEYNNIYTKERRQRDQSFRIKQNLRNRIRIALKSEPKISTTEDLIGCSIKELKHWLEQKFTENMSWENYGIWHVDHIIPCASFDLTDPEQQKICFHYTNLQPLWALDNLIKGSKVQ